MLSNKLQDDFAFGLLLLALISACFIPNDYFNTRPENYLLPFIAAVLIFRQKLLVDVPFSIIILAWFATSCFSVFINQLDHYYLGYSYRIIKYLLFFLLGLNILGSPPYKRIFVFLVEMMVLLILLITIIEHFNPYGLGDKLFAFYTHHIPDKFYKNNSIRHIGTMMNPNDNGALLLCLTCFFVALYYQAAKWKYLIYILITVILILLAQSRTALLALIVVAIVYVLLFLSKKKAILYLFVGLGSLALGIYFLKLDYIGQLFSKNITDIPELKSRYADWQIQYDLWKTNPWFGIGHITDYSIFKFAADSEYLFILATKGIIGLLNVALLIVYPIILLIRNKKEVRYKPMLILLPVAILVIAMTNFFLLNVRLSSCYFILLALPFSSLINKNRFIQISMLKHYFRKS